MISESLMLGVVVATYPSGNSVDVLLEDGSRLSNVQVAVPSGSYDTGAFDLPHVAGAGDMARWEFTAERNRYVRALVATCRGVPVVVGFLLPQVCQMTFDEPNRRIMRHGSDVYTSIDDAGNVELAHPGGAFLRIGTSPAHEDLTGKDVDKRWKIARNTGKQVYIRLSIPGKFTLTVAPSGAVTLDAAAAVAVTAPSVTLDTPETTCTGHLTVQNGLSVSGGTGAAATIAGDVAVTGGNVTADGIGLKTHRHTGVDAGSSTSGGPTA